MSTQKSASVTIVKQSNSRTLPQIPNQALLVSGSKVPRSPAFNSVSTGSPASDRRATVVPSRVARASQKTRPARTTKLVRTQPNRSTTTLAVGRLPQTGEATLGFAVLLGLLLLVTLGIKAFHHARILKK
ncbi:LPXTG cell wall anchor domain-containing protein [Levilactobacillus sp. HBUAS70063]|uniref:LPXTG cell wall anchor domain-containing protein n=1 Tax=Levilactobacillus sp. HBUAS70063 TaxID=3109359 RepID=UPI003132D5DC